jgi:alpha-mannosidase
MLFFLFSTNVYSQHVDLSKDKVLYTVGYAHLDTEWRWDYQTTIRKYIWNTMEDNFRLFEKYPAYVFNFSGANRYMMMREYYPAQYDSVKMYVAAGRWFPAGSSMEESDVLVPSHESIIRQVLLGNNFFRKEFGFASNEYMLPDCFGFPASLPSILAHCGIKGFSTQKLTWASAVGIPFNVGVWIGADGESVLAALNPGRYSTRVGDNLNDNTYWRNRVLDQGAKTGAFADYMYYGVGDIGGSPTEESVQWIQKSVENSKDIKILSAKADQLFVDVTPEQRAKLPTYKGELLLTNHSAGSVTSAAFMKRWNRKNEILAYNAEASSIMGEWLGGTTYNRDKMNEAWRLLAGTQFHDILPGTSIPRAYDYAWNDEMLAAYQWSDILADASGAVIRALDTRGKGIPIVVFNPLSFEREDIVETRVTFRTDLPKALRAYDRNNKEVPSQIRTIDGNRVAILFLAKTPSLSYVTYDIRPSDAPCMLSTGLNVTPRSLENARYLVRINDDGDVFSIVDKTVNKELLSSPIRLAFQYERPELYPAWNMDWTDRKKPPTGYVVGPATIRIVEEGPARIAIEVERESRHSKFVQRIRLTAGGLRVEFDTKIDWATKESSLKAAFPLTVSNPVATYNYGVGTVQRGNNDSLKFEVPSHQWFDVTDKDGTYGVSVLDDCKYGSDKPADNTVRLTLLYTPGVRYSYSDQAVQDFGKHEMLYALYGHEGDWREGSSNLQAKRLNQPLIAFQASSHKGTLGKVFSFLSISNPDVLLSAMKKRENSDDLIVRIVEAKGREGRGVELAFAAPVVSAREVNGQEQDISTAIVRNGKLVFDTAPYHLRTFAVRLQPTRGRLGLPKSAPIELPFNVDVVSYDKNKGDGDFDDQGTSFPAELFPETITAENITFRLGPKTNGAINAVACMGQTMKLPDGKFNRLYLLAASADTLRRVTFRVGKESVEIPIDGWSGFVGQWDRRVWRGAGIAETSYDRNNVEYAGLIPAYQKKVKVAYYTTHRHLNSGDNDPYSYAYLYRYAIDIPANAKEITFPSDEKIRVLAATAAYNENDDTVPAQSVLDELNRDSKEYERFMACSQPKISPDRAYIDNKGPLTVTMSSDDKAAEIRYTLDGTVPTIDSPLYTSAISVNQTVVAKAIAINKVKLPSVVSAANFSRSLPIERAQYLSPPAQRRSGSGGENTLIDLVRATIEVGDRAWQGYDKNDLDVILDLGQLRDLQEITLGCLENPDARAFLPASIEISVSGDNKEHRTVVTQNLIVPEKAQAASVKDLSSHLANVKAQYIRVRAKNVGTLPEWHPDAGANAWMYFDEIIVR